MDRLEEAMDQMQRDVLRFSEMLPDVDLRNKVSFKCFAAFPLFSGEVPSDHKQNCKVLLRLDFESIDTLYSKLFSQPHGTLSLDSENLFKTIVGRYIGLHSTIPLKTCSEEFSEGERLSRMNRATIDGALENISSMDDNENISINTVRGKLAERNVLGAIQNSSYRKTKFKDEYKSYPLDKKGDLDFKESKKEERYPLKRKSSEAFVLIGRGSIKALLQVEDSRIGHKGFPAVIEKLGKEKIEIFELLEEKGLKTFEFVNKDDWIERLEKYFDCKECQVKNRTQLIGDKLRLTDPENIQEVLVYGDQSHTGILDN